MKPAETEKEKGCPTRTPMQQEIRGPLAPSAEAPTFGTTPYAAMTAGGGLLDVSPPAVTEAQPATFETTRPAGGLGVGAASSSPLLGTSAAGVGSTLGKKPEETVVAPEERGAAAGPSGGVAVPSPAQAAEAINRGIEGAEHVLEVRTTCT